MLINYRTLAVSRPLSSCRNHKGSNSVIGLEATDVDLNFNLLTPSWSILININATFETATYRKLQVATLLNTAMAKTSSHVAMAMTSS